MSVAMSFPPSLYFINLKIFNSVYVIKQIIHRMINNTVLDFCFVVFVSLPFMNNLQIR